VIYTYVAGEGGVVIYSTGLVICIQGEGWGKPFGKHVFLSGVNEI
jgi:hypothetical protein